MALILEGGRWMTPIPPLHRSNLSLLLCHASMSCATSITLIYSIWSKASPHKSCVWIVYVLCSICVFICVWVHLSAQPGHAECTDEYQSPALGWTVWWALGSPLCTAGKMRLNCGLMWGWCESGFSSQISLSGQQTHALRLPLLCQCKQISRADEIYTERPEKYKDPHYVMKCNNVGI